MKGIGIFEKTFERPSFGATLDAVADHGLRHIQLHLEVVGLEPMPLEIPDTVVETIQRETTVRGIQVAALSATYNMAHPDPAVRDDGLARLSVMAAACRALGTTVLTLCTGTRDRDNKWRHHPDNATPEAWADLSASLSDALVIAERHDLTLAVEPEPANVMRDALTARRLMDEIGGDRLKIILDPANIVAGALDCPPAESLADAFALLGGDIVVAHAKDVDATGHFCSAGSGIVPWDVYLTQISEAGFTGPLILHTLTEADVPGCVATLTGGMGSDSDGPDPPPLLGEPGE